MDLCEEQGPEEATLSSESEDTFLFVDIEQTRNMTVKDIIDTLLDKNAYDPTIRPSFYDNGRAVRLEVDIVLNTLGPVIEREMQMTASFYLRQQWRDPRLVYSPPHNLGNDSLLLSERRAGSMWLPDLYFSQSKDEKAHDITVPNLMIRIYPDGTVLYSQRLTVTFQCLMNLRKFPLDDQICYIRMESYGHTTDGMYFAWSSSRKSMDILENAHIPDFKLTAITAHDCTATYATGTFPCLEARLKLQRQIGFYLIQTYIPCMLIVSLSWLSFWLDTHAIPARISVGLLTVLTITTQSSSVRSELPRVPYTKSIDVWISVCLVFVFFAYMQYAFVTVFSRRHRKTMGQFVSSANRQTDKNGANSQNSTIPETGCHTCTAANNSKPPSGQCPDGKLPSDRAADSKPRGQAGHGHGNQLHGNVPDYQAISRQLWENLLKDMYLRQQMDIFGWVPVTVIGAFNMMLRLITNAAQRHNIISVAARRCQNVEVSPCGQLLRPATDPASWPVNPKMKVPWLVSGQNVSADRS
ncbi:glycine receptor subunit alpha-4-like [Babylonia areolata]|uniref:glycine receptor subunit alpha-4-like n=1 Tax=Babylonia areolata TaxID=304850 RepID=UPI003FCFB82F